MRTIWKFWLTTKNRQKAVSVADKVFRQMEVTPVAVDIEPYEKTGDFVIRCELELECLSWDNCVVTTIGMGQRIAHQWILFGDVYRDLSGWSKNPSVIGVAAIEWMLVTPSVADGPI
jgi:hypothetical protein